MPRKKTLVNPPALPEFTPPEASTALTVLPNDTDLYQEIVALLNLSTSADDLVRKAVGFHRFARELHAQRQAFGLAIAEMAEQVHDLELWRLYPGDEYASEEDYWESTGWRMREVLQLLRYRRESVPFLEAAGLDPVDVFQRTSEAGLVEVTKVVRGALRDRPDVLSEPLTPETRELVRERVLAFVDKPDREVRATAKSMRNEPMKTPAYITMSIVSTDEGIKLRGSFTFTLATVEAIANGNAFFKWLLDGSEANWYQVFTTMQAAQKAHAVETGDTRLDFGYDEEDLLAAFDLRAS